MQLDDWNFEVVCVRARKVKRYGMPYKSVLTITIVDGQPHVEGLIAKDRFNKKDKNTIETYIGSLGYKYYMTSHYKDGKRIINKIKL
jgi:hypothetical protein